MLGFLSFLAFGFSIAFVVSLVLVVIRSVKKQPRKPFVVLAVVSVVAFLALSVPISQLYVPAEKPEEITESAESEQAESAPVSDSVPASSKNVDNSVKSVDKKVASQETESAKDEQPADPAPAEKSENSDAPASADSPDESEGDVPGLLSDLVYNGEPVIDVAVRDLKKEGILDVAYVVDEESKKVNIAVIVLSGTPVDDVKKTGEKCARYLSALANFADASYAPPSNDSLGGLWDVYSFLLYLDDGSESVDVWGAKAVNSPVIRWKVPK